MKISTTALLVLCLLALNPGLPGASDNDQQKIVLSEAHKDLACSACHAGETAVLQQERKEARRCISCHSEFDSIFTQAMTTRLAEQDFVHQTFDQSDPQFFEKNCRGCHVTSCLDCHGDSSHNVIRPNKDTCMKCHRGYFVGADYYGLAPKEDHLRYQNNPGPDGEAYLKMLPDVHYRAGMGCSDCHSMVSLAEGRKSSKSCTDCHAAATDILEHSIAKHLTSMECYACHSSWAPQEYGTFYLRFRESTLQKYFKLKKTGHAEYIKSGYLKKQDSPPLGLNSRGKISPLRPQFIVYFSDIVNDKVRGEENRLLNAQWKAFFPHTISKGSVLCDDCHNAPKRFLLEAPKDRIYQLEKDGMGLGSFWDRIGQHVINGEFLEEARVRALSAKTPAYRRAYIKKWKNLLNHVDASSE